MLLRLFFINIFFIQFLVACGGGGGNSSTGDNDQTNPGSNTSLDNGAGLNKDTDDFKGEKVIGFNAVTSAEVVNSVCFSKIPDYRELNEKYYNLSLLPPLQDYTFNYISNVGEFGSSEIEFTFSNQNQNSYDLLTGVLFNTKRTNPTTRSTELFVSNNKPIYNAIRGFCRDVQCAADSVFGESWGLRFLFKDRFGLVLSGHVDPNTEEYPDESYLGSVAVAALSFPKGTFPLNRDLFSPATREFVPQNVVLAPYSSNLAPPSGLESAAAVTFSSRSGVTEIQSSVSNADVYFLEPWKSERDFHSRVSTVFHELIHVLDQAKENQIVLSKTNEWLKISDWKLDPRTEQWVMGKPETKCSEYGASQPVEDFAECGTMYRFAPLKLKKISAAKYNFFKKRVFQGTEYHQHAACKNSIETI